MRSAGLLIAAALGAVLLSCGSVSNGEFDYVTATASADPAKNPLFADLATWTGTPCAAGSTYTVFSDIVTFSVVSKVNVSNANSSPLVLKGATLSYSPADVLTPALPKAYSPTYQALNGYIVPAGNTLPVPVEVAPHSLKNFLGASLVCTASNSIYSYTVTIIFDAEEQVSGRSGTFTSGITVRFADFADK